MPKSGGLSIVLAAALILVSGVASRADITSTFDSGVDGWTGYILSSNFSGNPPSVLWVQAPVYHASGGNPGGYITTTDPGGNVENHFVAPSRFLGNLTSYYGGSLTFDEMDDEGFYGYSNDNYNEVELVGNGHTLFFDGSDMVAAPNTWYHEVVPLQPSSRWRLDDYVSGPTPTAADFLTVLANVNQLDIQGDLNSGNDLTGLDNVYLGSPGQPGIPEPSTLLLLATSGVGLLGFARRRKV